MQKTAAGNRSWYLCKELFPKIWLCNYLAGAVVGILAARYSTAAMPDAAAKLCTLARERLSVLSLFCSAMLFVVLTILLSQLLGGGMFVLFLTALKASCTAYVAGLFYQFRIPMELDPALLRFSTHAALLLPAFYMTASSSCVDLAGEGGILPFILPFLYLPLLALLEFFIWSAGIL